MKLFITISVLCNWCAQCQFIDASNNIIDNLFDYFFCGVNNPPAIFYLHTTNGYTEINDPTNLETNNTLPTYFSFHSWQSNSDNDGVADTLYNTSSCNVIKVDYRHMATKPYYCAPTIVDVVGSFVSAFIVQAHEANKINVSETRFIGLSLGSHVSGKAGLEIQKSLHIQIARITALDPAGPLFAFPLRFFSRDSLSRHSAKFVDALHTSDILGTVEPIGHVDIYALGLFGGILIQRPCLEDIPFKILCSHLISRDYYKESITSCALRVNQFYGSLNNIPYGYHMPEDLRGIFTFTPNSESPYGTGNPECLTF